MLFPQLFTCFQKNDVFFLFKLMIKIRFLHKCINSGIFFLCTSKFSELTLEELNDIGKYICTKKATKNENKLLIQRTCFKDYLLVSKLFLFFVCWVPCGWQTTRIEGRCQAT